MFFRKFSKRRVGKFCSEINAILISGSLKVLIPAKSCEQFLLYRRTALAVAGFCLIRLLLTLGLRLAIWA